MQTSKCDWFFIVIRISEIELFLQSAQVAIFFPQKALILLSLLGNIAEPFDNWITQADIYTYVWLFSFFSNTHVDIRGFCSSKMQKFFQTAPKRLLGE